MAGIFTEIYGPVFTESAFRRYIYFIRAMANNKNHIVLCKDTVKHIKEKNVSLISN